jgi:hypothetical protein
MHRAVERDIKPAQTQFCAIGFLFGTECFTESIRSPLGTGVEGPQNVSESRWCCAITLNGAPAAAHCYLEPELRLQAQASG